MAYAPNYDTFVLGCFRHKETDAFFEFTSDGTYPYAAILKAVAYVVVNEYGHFVTEKWQIKQHKVY